MGDRRMDANFNQLDEKLAELLKQAADVAGQIQAQQQGPGRPSSIKSRSQPRLVNV